MRGRTVVTTVGIVLAAGAGTRYGLPKALVSCDDGTPWLHRAVAALRGAGCDPVLVALGAERDRASRLVPARADVVEVPRWRDGMAESLREALRAADATDADAAVIVPVDTPDLPAAVVARVAAGATAASLARAVYLGAPGHPVLIGRAHWHSVAASVRGDRGAGDYLAAHGARSLECADLWHGADIDRPAGT